jgi:hypothetical protein
MIRQEPEQAFNKKERDQAPKQPSLPGRNQKNKKTPGAVLTSP